MDDSSLGIRCTVIDLGLARIDGGRGDVSWTSPEDEVFDGEGDYQYDIYRMMRAHNAGNWRIFRPLSNVMVGGLLNSQTYLTNDDFYSGFIIL